MTAMPPPPPPPPGSATVPPAPPPPPPPPPPPGAAARPHRSLGRRVVRAVILGVVTGLAGALGLAFALTGSLGPAPAAAQVCREVPTPALDDPVAGSVVRRTVCDDIDTTLDVPLGGVDGFEGVFKAPEPPSDPAVPRPTYLVWASDGCSAPVLGAGPFDFTLACNRHDFGWRNLQQFDEPDAPVWHVGNKDRVDAGFFYDMRYRCAALPRIQQIACDTTARIYYTAVHLNPAGVAGLPGRTP